MRRALVVLALAVAVVAVILVARRGESPPRFAGCPVFPASSPWNRRVDRLPVAPRSASLLRSLGARRPLLPYFGNGRGIPVVAVPQGAPKARVRFAFASESDRGPYPIPRGVPLEDDADRHVSIVERGSCRLYELFRLRRAPGGWEAGSGAIWDLRSNDLRPRGWTSADAAGLPILPGLVRYDEVARGRVRHALRFAAPRTRSAYVFPARHEAGAGSDPSLMPMGTRVRLRASFDARRFPTQARVVLDALKRYGMLLADNGPNWVVVGAPDPRWRETELRTLERLRPADFEVVDAS